MTNSDQSAFETLIDEIHTDFSDNPVNYGNEDPVIPELIHRLRQKIDVDYLPVEYRQEYADNDQWRVRDFSTRVDNIGQATRIRPEVLFVHEGERWKYERTLAGEIKSTVPKFDLVVFNPEPPLIAQSKAEGPGNYWDTENDISVLCEVKHSKNESSNFFAESNGADDVQALSQYPGSVERRVFLFFDWWPIDGNQSHRYERHRDRLIENVGTVSEPVDVIFLSRIGDYHTFTIGN